MGEKSHITSAQLKKQLSDPDIEKEVIPRLSGSMYLAIKSRQVQALRSERYVGKNRFKPRSETDHFAQTAMIKMLQLTHRMAAQLDPDHFNVSTNNIAVTITPQSPQAEKFLKEATST